jgi:APA family basic amino acid/polyamine antiporter
VGVTGAIVLLAAVTTSFSGAGRLALSLGRYGMLPHAFARLSPRTLLPPVAVAAAAIASCALLSIAWAVGGEVRFLASIYSFGILIAFTAAQLAVVRLRRREPGLERPFRAPGMPFLGLAGAAATASILVLALATHEASRVAGPVWLLVGLGLFLWVRGGRALERARAPIADLVPEVEGAYERILVPLKLGPIGEEVLGTALRLAEERGGRVLVLHVLRVALDKDLDAPLPDAEGLARASLAEAASLAREQGVTVETRLVRDRALSKAIVEQARSFRADLIVVGSAPRWRRQSRFFSPTVEQVLRKAPCEVMVVAYPQGVLEEISS